MMDMLQRNYQRLLQIIRSFISFVVFIFALVCISFLTVLKIWFNCTKTVFLGILSLKSNNTLTKVFEESAPSDAKASTSEHETSPVENKSFVPTTIRRHRKRSVQRSPNINNLLPSMKCSEARIDYNPFTLESQQNIDDKHLAGQFSECGGSYNVKQFYGSPVALTTLTNPGQERKTCFEKDFKRRDIAKIISSYHNLPSDRSCQKSSCIASEFYRFATPDSPKIPMKDYVSLKQEKVKYRSPPPTFERSRSVKFSEASPYAIPSNVDSYHAFSITPKSLPFLRESTDSGLVLCDFKN